VYNIVVQLSRISGKKHVSVYLCVCVSATQRGRIRRVYYTAAEVQSASACSVQASRVAAERSWPAPKSLCNTETAERSSCTSARAGGPGKLHGKHGRTDFRKITTTIMCIILYYVEVHNIIRTCVCVCVCGGSVF